MKQLTILLMLLSSFVFGQFSTPNVEAVYGGRILDIDGYAKNTDTTRFYISTESANSLFYCDAYTNTSNPVFGMWHVVPTADADAGFGSSVRQIAAHSTSGNVIFANNDGLYSTSPSSSSVATIVSANVQGFHLDGDFFFYQMGSELHFGELDATCSFAENSASPLALSAIGVNPVFYTHPLTNILYVFFPGQPPALYKLDAAYDGTTVPSSVTDITPSLDSVNVEWRAFGIAPDGRLFFFGSDGEDKFCAYSDDETNWTEFSIGIGGVAGPDIHFSGDSTNYYVYTSTVYSDSNGYEGSWKYFGSVGGMETHPNDGPVFADPINENLVLMTTDQGLGASKDNGETIFEIDDGIEAVQVSDFDMTESEYTGWLASKSGIRRVTDFKTSPTWTNAIFPTNDGSPYFSVAIDKFDSLTVYAGNVRVYKTTDNGNTWRRVFTPEDYGFPHVGTMCNALESFPYEPNIIFAGFEVMNESKGGLFYSSDSGATWSQILLEASSDGEDVDVTDIVFNIENGDTVAYATVLYDLSLPQGYSIYRIVKNGDSWIPSQDMSPSRTSTGSVIVVSLYDVELSETGDTVYAVGTDAGVNEPHVYYKPITATGLWTPVTSSGFSSTTGIASAVTIGGDTVFAAVNNEVYYYIPGTSTQWTLGYSYPLGTEINVLFYDELLVGTNLGFYNHAVTRPNDVEEKENIPLKFELSQNYPNPFNPSTVINYTLPEIAGATNVTLKIYDLLGREITTLVNEKQSAGNYSVNFNANGLTSGVYFYKLTAGSFVATKKMILLK